MWKGRYNFAACYLSHMNKVLNYINQFSIVEPKSVKNKGLWRGSSIMPLD